MVIITATESACRMLNSGDANELSFKVVNMLEKTDKDMEQNVSKEELESIDDR